ncbi:hypothetical protein [Streptomyces sp. HUAS TT3]
MPRIGTGRGTCFNRLEQQRGIATTYDKTAQSYKAAVVLTSFLM